MLPLSDNVNEILDHALARGEAALQTIEPLTQPERSPLPWETQFELMKAQTALRLQANAIRHLRETIEDEVLFDQTRLTK